MTLTLGRAEGVNLCGKKVLADTIKPKRLDRGTRSWALPGSTIYHRPLGRGPSFLVTETQSHGDRSELAAPPALDMEGQAAGPGLQGLQELEEATEAVINHSSQIYVYIHVYTHIHTCIYSYI